MQQYYLCRFGGGPHTISGQLFAMLNKTDLTPEQLFVVPNINGDIKQNIQKFFAFCSRNRQFTQHMFSLCFDSRYQQLEEQNKKKVAQYTVEVLSIDEDALTELLFGPQQNLKNSSQISEKIQLDSSDNIETEAQRLFSDDSSKPEQNQWESQPLVFEKFELVKLSLKHLERQNINETCLGYVHKIYSSLLRRQGKYFLEFLDQNNQYLNLIFQNLSYPSISNILSLALSSQDKSGEYQYETLKKQIFEKLLDYGYSNIENFQKFQGFIITVEEILNFTKQSYYEYFEDFKRCANVLVCEATLSKFYDYLVNGSKQAFSNSSSYLQLIIRRINTENDDNDYYRQQETTEPSMKFEHQFLLSHLAILTDLLEKSWTYTPIVRVSYLTFLLNVLKSQKDTQGDIGNFQIFSKIFDSYCKEKSQGIIKNQLYQILELLIKNMKNEELSELSQWFISDNSTDILISGRLQSETTVARNTDMKSCYILSLLFQIEKKNKGFLESLSEKSKTYTIQINQLYSTKLAEKGQEAAFDLQFLIPQKFSQVLQPKEDLPKQQPKQLNNGGKNNIFIPSLNLPNKKQNQQIVIEVENVEQFELPQQQSRQSLIQDLKNTIIKLPQKFNNKKQLKNPEIKPDRDNNNQKSSQVVYDFYIRHLMLF